MLERIVRTIFTIIIAGMLLGAQAIMSTSVKPVQVVSGGGTADIKVSKTGNSTEYSTMELSESVLHLYTMMFLQTNGITQVNSICRS